MRDDVFKLSNLVIGLIIVGCRNYGCQLSVIGYRLREGVVKRKPLHRKLKTERVA